MHRRGEKKSITARAKELVADQYKKRRSQFAELERHNEYLQVYNKAIIDKLEVECGPYMRVILRSHWINTRIKVVVSLAVLASGLHQSTLIKKLKFLSQSSISRYLSQFSSAVTHPSFYEKYIAFPKDAEERQYLKDRFFEKFYIPDAIGCITSIVVPMKRPPALGKDDIFAWHDGTFACRVTLITDADGNIMYVAATSSVATQEYYKSSNNNIFQQLDEVIETDEVVYLLGDSSYPQRPYLMTPFPSVKKDTPEAHYNTKHSLVMQTSKTVIEELKARFPCLCIPKGLVYSPAIVENIVTCCCVLHNMCNEAQLPAPVKQGQEVEVKKKKFRWMPDDKVVGDDPDECQMEKAKEARVKLVNELWECRF